MSKYFADQVQQLLNTTFSAEEVALLQHPHKRFLSRLKRAVLILKQSPESRPAVIEQLKGILRDIQIFKEKEKQRLKSYQEKRKQMKRVELVVTKEDYARWVKQANKQGVRSLSKYMQSLLAQATHSFEQG